MRRRPPRKSVSGLQKNRINPARPVTSQWIGLYGLASNPFWLVMLSDVYLEGDQLPRNRAALTQTFVDRWLAYEADACRDYRLAPPTRRETLQARFWGVRGTEVQSQSNAVMRQRMPQWAGLSHREVPCQFFAGAAQCLAIGLAAPRGDGG